MLGIDDIVEGVAGGAALGVGFVAVTAAAVFGGPRAKNLAKEGIKRYFVATERAREWTAEAVERVQDLYAEARYEYESGLNREGEGVADVTTPSGAADPLAETSTEARARRKSESGGSRIATPASAA